MDGVLLDYNAGRMILSSAVQSEALAMKGLQVAAAAACRAGPASSGFRVRRLLHALATTMIANPLSPVRNAAHYATDAVLSALTVSFLVPIYRKQQYRALFNMQGKSSPRKLCHQQDQASTHKDLPV